MMTQPTLRLLAVEDSPVYLELLAETLKHVPGVELEREFARNGKEALRKFRSFRPQMVLLDIHLPDSLGLDLLEAFLKIAPATHIVMLTSDAQAEHVFRARQLGAQGYILKPFQAKRVYQAIETCLVSGCAEGEPEHQVDAQTVADYFAPEDAALAKETSRTAAKEFQSFGHIASTWRVLSIDADTQNQRNIAAFFAAHMTHFDAAYSAAEGWARVEMQPYDVVLIAASLEDMDACQLANQIRLKTQQNPVGPCLLLMCRPVDDIPAGRLQLAGIQGRLNTPIHAVDLKKALEPFARLYAEAAHEQYLF